MLRVFFKTKLYNLTIKLFMLEQHILLCLLIHLHKNRLIFFCFFLNTLECDRILKTEIFSVDLSVYGVSVGYECPLGQAFLTAVVPEETFAVSINMTCQWDGTWDRSHPQLEECRPVGCVFPPDPDPDLHLVRSGYTEHVPVPFGEHVTYECESGCGQTRIIQFLLKFFFCTVYGKSVCALVLLQQLLLRRRLPPRGLEGHLPGHRAVDRPPALERMRAAHRRDIFFPLHVIHYI